MSIQVKDLVHIYDKGMPTEQLALDKISFQVDDGELLGIIGHTGSGKSTLLQHLNGLLKADGGSIVVDGVDITGQGVSMVQIRRRIGLVFQYPEYQLFEETVEKDVAFGPENLGLTEDEVKRRVKDAIGLVGLDFEEIRERSPFELSGGQKRRVAIAGVIAMGPEVLILDEPTAGLDPKAHKDILKMIVDVHEKTKNITILVSHNMDDIAMLSDKVLVIDSGKLVTIGTPQEVFSQKEILRKVGLELPPITTFTETLREKEITIKPTILTLDDACEEISKYMIGKKTDD